MEKKIVYTCAICGKEYGAIAGRVQCESTCLEKQKEIAAKAEKEQKKKEQEARRQKVVAAIRNASTELEAYIDDYGSFSYNSADELVETDNNEVSKVEPTEQTASEAKITLSEKWPFDWFPKLWHDFW